jgi:nitroimidazol reductase NimA-like FMN-containing flavoprotein (pyridoxamine 5'-phosphate oxidase superfamily)
MVCDRPHLGELSRDECDRLLAASQIGRVVMTADALPVALPVNYSYDGSEIVFRTGEGAKMSAAREGVVVAFEIDDFDPETRTGWSVLATGIARVVTGPGAVLRADRLRLESWWVSDGHYVAIDVGLLSGRRIGGATVPTPD